MQVSSAMHNVRARSYALLLIAGMTFCAACSAERQPNAATAVSSDASVSEPSTATGDHAYFDWLSGQPSVIQSVSLRRPEEIDEHYFGKKRQPYVEYNAEQDACQWPFASGKGSFFHGQLRIDYPNVSSGKILLYWEAKWGAGWAKASNFRGGKGQGEHKAFQIARDGPGDERRFETQVRYRYGPTPRLPLRGKQIAHLTLRTYGGGGIEPGGQPVSGQRKNFIIYPERWVRFWQEVDIDNKTFSWWVADEERGVVQLFDKRRFEGIGNLPYNWFWFEWNASTERPGGDMIYTWGRNFAVLHDYEEDAASLVEANRW